MPVYSAKVVKENGKRTAKNRVLSVCKTGLFLVSILAKQCNLRNGINGQKFRISGEPEHNLQVATD
jgi:hypothetical protein